jgi:hypothetical protein
VSAWSPHPSADGRCSASIPAAIRRSDGGQLDAFDREIAAR